MHKKIAWIFPGQGAQYSGMGKDFYDAFPASKEVFQEADDLLSSHFSALIFSGSAEELSLTKNSQLAIYVVSIAILRAIEAQLPDLAPYVCAGLSLGEYTALAASQKISFAEGLALIRHRSTFMHEACTATPGTMRVVLGLEGDKVHEVLSSFSDVWVANLNCPGQVVIAGSHESMDAAAASLKEKGAKRVLPLEVSGAFHSPFMKAAQDRLAPYIEQTSFLSSPISLVMNVPGDFVSELSDMRKNLILQVTHPVLWEKGVLAMRAQGVSLYIEMGPGKTLTGMNKRIDPLLETLNIEKVTDMENVLCSF